jgi:hypothetical protein
MSGGRDVLGSAAPLHNDGVSTSETAFKSTLYRVQ